MCVCVCSNICIYAELYVCMLSWVIISCRSVCVGVCVCTVIYTNIYAELSVDEMQGCVCV